ncbi:Hypothetical predicted protein [Olea europaea subsp. europaea]|uniref:Uncharacterized protein n=1 Tax=Olea europaea subsp. europaea TaxID=158383 RepID=A0A8S0SE30_OLEEU|nr:Hypothetical predicted protein [Olea europaea subsp. europaea]
MEADDLGLSALMGRVLYRSVSWWVQVGIDFDEDEGLQDDGWSGNIETAGFSLKLPMVVVAIGDDRDGMVEFG